MKDSGSRSQHHYVLAHMALRKFCESNPIMFFLTLTSPHRNALLSDIWEQVCKMCDDSGKPDFDITNIGIENTKLKNYTSILFTFPKPVEVPEAYYSALVLKMDLFKEMPLAPPEVPPEIAYYTLEYGDNLDGTKPYTVLGEWAGDTHRNRGKGPSPTTVGFLTSVEACL